MRIRKILTLSNRRLAAFESVRCDRCNEKSAWMKTEWRSVPILHSCRFPICKNKTGKGYQTKGAKNMWYVVQVRTGTEESIVQQCEKNVSDGVLERCFIPYYEEKRHIRGVWTVHKKILFPGYVFVVTEKIEGLFIELQNVIGLTKLLGIGDDIVPLREEETQFLLTFGGEKQVVEMSEGIIEQSKVRVISGPLQGMEGCIRKIDRHKRKAYLEVEMFGRMQRVQVGLEIISKTI